MKTPAIIASLTIVGSIAYAAGQGVAGKQASAMPSGAQAHSMQEQEPPSGIMQGARTDCPSGEPVTWFLQTPHIIECNNSGGTGIGVLGGGAVDVNGDGRLEFYGGTGYASQDIVLNGSSIGVSLSIWVNRIDPATQKPTAIRDLVEVIPSSLGQWVLATYPSTTVATVYIADTDDYNFGNRSSGWRDMDADGDLDYLVRLYVQSGSASPVYSQIWFENTGFEKAAPPVAADLNRDGRVDGADLGMLLVAWGPNP